ncbi:MAG: hypothetical protein CVU39_18450 [Chloroflexi bacterium HGW-Chloroflexi-10]|nr:MAG: hypothetical protein CVU39_18450 [Chloroflexi bacterium HGW-Chloroflexi-10]
MDKQYMEPYTSYLLSTIGYTTATGLSRMVEGLLMHDQITRILSAEIFTSKDLWTLVKPTVREIEKEEAVLIFDDTIQEKPYTDENEVVCWHFDHTKSRAVQGVNLRVITQNNHVFAVLYAVFKLECLSIKRHLNHFALRAQLYLKAFHVALDELQILKAA